MTDIEFLNDPFEWPHWPLLPMVSLNKEKHPRYPFCGVMVSAEPRWRVYHKTLGSFETGELKAQLLGVAFDEYAGPEALLKEWRID